MNIHRDTDAHIVVVTDKNMVDPTIVLACSIFRRIFGIIHLHVVCDQLQEETRMKIQGILESEKGPHMVSLISVDSETLCAGLDQKIHLTRAAYIRLFFDKLFPDLKRIIYMDTDMLVVRGFHPGRLLSSVNEHSVAAVEEPGLHNIYQKAHPDTLFHRAFNTGFLVMNLERLRSLHLLPKIIQWLQSHMKDVLYADQDGFDALLSDDCTWLDESYNAIKGNVKNPYVLHYAGTNRKPWSPKASLISTRSMLSTLPYVLFRQKTPVRQPLPQALQLICMQAVSAFLRVTITHRIYNFRKMLEKRSGNFTSVKRA